MMKKLILFSSFILVIFSFAAASAQTRKAVGAAEVTGTFRNVSGSEFKILALGKGKLRVAFSGNYEYKMANGEMMANVGEAAGEAAISADTATFKPADTQQCTITLKFLTRGRIRVMQSGTDSECGFGRNVSAAGDYKKISARRPKF